MRSFNVVNYGKDLVQITNKFKREIDRKLTCFELTSIQSRILCFILDEEEKRDIFQKDIEEEFDLRAPTVTSIIQNLEKTNYVKRINALNDQRLKKIVLTNKAYEIVLKIKKIMDETEEETFANLSASESAMLNKIISKINKNIKNF